MATLLLSACGQAPAPAPKPTEAPKPAEAAKPAAPAATTAPAAPAAAAKPTEAAKPAAAAPAAGGGAKVLKVAIPRDADRLDPQRTTIGVSVFLNSMLYDSLMSIDKSGKLAPQLATSWQPSDDQRTWTIKLAEGVKFHDGSTFDAESVVKSWQRMLAAETTAPLKFALGDVQEVKAVDKQTFSLTTAKPQATLPNFVFVYPGLFGILSAAAIDKNGLDYGQKPIGTGPFKLVEWVNGNSITLERNPDYNLKTAYYGSGGPPKVDRIVFQVLPEAQVRLDAFQKGDVQVYLRDIPGKDLAKIQQASQFKTLTVPSIATFYLGLNVEKDVTSDPAVRKALAYAMDREAIVQQVIDGQGTSAYGYLPKVYEGRGYADPQLQQKPGYTFSVAKAKQALEEAGWKADASGNRSKNGQKLTLDYWAANILPDKAIAEAVQAMARDVGIDVQLQTFESSAFWNSLKEGKMNAWSGTGLIFEPDMLTYQFHSKSIPGTNRYRYNKPQVDQMLDEARSTVDLPKRDAIYKSVQEIIMTDAPGIPLYSQIRVDAYAGTVQGFNNHHLFDEYPLWNELTMG